jgi:hypothetical protein
MTHDLKTRPRPFCDVQAGRKTAEFRKNDRNFKLWDRLLLRAWDLDTGYLTSKGWEPILVEVTNIQYGPQWGIPEGYCVMSIRPVEAEDGR